MLYAAQCTIALVPLLCAQVLEIDDRRRPTNRDNMFEEWNLGAEPAVGNIVPQEPWWNKFNVYPDWRADGTDRPRPPRELAARLQEGAVFNIEAGEWVDPEECRQEPIVG